MYGGFDDVQRHLTSETSEAVYLNNCVVFSNNLTWQKTFLLFTFLPLWFHVKPTFPNHRCRRWDDKRFLSFFFLTTDEKVIGGRMCTGLDAWLNPPFVFAIELIWAQEPEVMFIFVFHWLEEAALILMRAKYVPSCKSLHIPCHGRNSPAELQLHLCWFQGCQTDHIFNLNHHWGDVD